MSNFQQKPNRSKGGGGSAVTMDSLIRLLDPAAVIGTPCTGHLAALDLLEPSARARVGLVGVPAPLAGEPRR